MRPAVVCAALCILCLGQVSAADEPAYVTVKFSVDANQNHFAQDRDDCLGAASRMRFSGRGTAPTNYATYNLDTFYGCMVQRGYRPDNNGRLAAQFYRRQAGEDYILLHV